MNWMMFGCRSERWLTISRYTFSSICAKTRPDRPDQHKAGTNSTESAPRRNQPKSKPRSRDEQRSQGPDPVPALDELDGYEPSGLPVAHQPRHPKVARPDVAHRLVLVHAVPGVCGRRRRARMQGVRGRREEVGRKGGKEGGRGARRGEAGRARRIGGCRRLGGGGGVVSGAVVSLSGVAPRWRCIYSRCTVGAERGPASVPCGVSRKEAPI